MNEHDNDCVPMLSVQRLKILIPYLLLLLIALEYLTGVIHNRRKVTLDIEGGVKQALVIRRNESGQQVLFAGNSLVFEDLQQSVLQDEMGHGFQVYTAGVPGSTYYDWRYGLRSLFARGSEPDVLVFSISPSQFLRPPAVTPVPVSVLWNTREILDYRRDQHLNLTSFTELLLEHYSTYFSLRDTVRTYVRKFIPGFEDMVGRWSTAAVSPVINVGPATEAAFVERLSWIAAECGTHTRLLLVIPPTNQLPDETLEPSLRAAAAKLGIPVIEPVAKRQWPLAAFKDDGYHLNVTAATQFSKLVAAGLKQALVESADRNIGQ